MKMIVIGLFHLYDKFQEYTQTPAEICQRRTPGLQVNRSHKDW